MRGPIAEDTKNDVVQKWLQGHQRDKIASDMQLGTGTVSTIILEWKKNIGIPDADTLRQFATELRRSSINTSECALGYRLLNLLAKLGVDDEDLESFVNKVYRQCQEYNIAPHEIVETSQQILSIRGSHPISQLPDHIKKQIVEAERLENELKRLREEKTNAQKERDEALEGSKMTSNAIDDFIRLKRLLDKFGLSFEESKIPKLVKVLHELQHSGYEPIMITEKLSSIGSLQTREDELQISITNKEERLRKNTEECARYEEKLDSHRMSLGLYGKLERDGIGLKELGSLRNIVSEISACHNNLSPYFAFKKFCRDIEGQYDKKLGFEGRIASMNEQLQKSQQNLHHISLEYAQKKNVLDMLTELMEYGVTQENIIQWTQICKESKLEISAVGSDLLEYGNLKSAYHSIYAKVQSLKSEAEDLDRKNDEHRKMIGTITNIIIGIMQDRLQKFTQAIQNIFHTAEDGLNCSTNSSIKKMQNTEQQLVNTGERAKGIVQSLELELNKQLDMFHKIGSSAEFSPLIKAARGQFVDPDELKLPIIRAIDIMISKLNSIASSVTKNKLEQARDSLQSECLIFS
jgi:hypothetical protein